MTVIAEKVLLEALGLSPVERAEIIERLFQSFDASSNRPEDAVWALEVESRITAYEEGKLSASSSEEVFARINRR